MDLHFYAKRWLFNLGLEQWNSCMKLSAHVCVCTCTHNYITFDSHTAMLLNLFSGLLAGV